VTLYADGKKLAERKNFSAPDKEAFILKVGEAGDNFGGSFEGAIQEVAFFQKVLPNAKSLSFQSFVNKSDLSWKNDKPKTPEQDGFVKIHNPSSDLYFSNIQIRPLPSSDLKQAIASWSELSLERGKKVYNGLCITCHGDTSKEGALPTALKFHEASFKNGSDPLSIYNTLTHGYGQMMPQAWMTEEQKMDVIHYIRETQISGSNDSQLFKITPQYLASLPSFVKSKNKKKVKVKPKPYLEMNFGNSLNLTLQVAPNNIVQKGIVTRLDQGDGGVTKGSTWAIFDEDTLQLAAVWSGDKFIDWRSIAFDGSHGTHPSSLGENLFLNPQSPGWAHPETGSWNDTRFKATDGRRYGPLNRNWAHFKGIYSHESKRIIHYTLGDSKVLDYTSFDKSTQTIIRTLNLSSIDKKLTMRVAPVSMQCEIQSDGNFKLFQNKGFHYLSVEAKQDTAKVAIYLSAQKTSQVDSKIIDLSKFIHGGQPQWNKSLSSPITAAPNDHAYVKDKFELPKNNPWKSWMRFTGIDFINDGKSALICTWEGEVWQVDGVNQTQGEVNWRRIANGLYQPLGLKVHKEKIYVGCRDQIAILHDLNNDGEIDYYESFNNDHQVTEHYHEFAMGLQTDKEGNFYYAKSARHAKLGLVPHHGTLLKVSAGGEKTEIIATGFRAANGVCVNDDGSFFVTDQEGHWTPKNRVNWVEPGGFYGNFMGSHNAKSSSDADMQEAMIWLTNKFNRSPGELMWAKSDRWGPLAGHLLELSYGMGAIFLNLIEEKNDIKQGGQVKIPNMDFDTGIMRGRFNPNDGQLYALGMFSWAGNKKDPGAFSRIRYTKKPVYVPTSLKTSEGELRLSFPVALADPTGSDFKVISWHIQRTKSYGAKHENEKVLSVSHAKISADRKTLILTIPELKATRCMSIKAKLKATNGHVFEFEINNTIHNL
jgi:mono/diheme cytochrome c family protein